MADSWGEATTAIQVGNDCANACTQVDLKAAHIRVHAYTGRALQLSEYFPLLPLVHWIQNMKESNPKLWGDNVTLWGNKSVAWIGRWTSKDETRTNYVHLKNIRRVLSSISGWAPCWCCALEHRILHAEWPPRLSRLSPFRPAGIKQSMHKCTIDESCHVEMWFRLWEPRKQVFQPRADELVNKNDGSCKFIINKFVNSAASLCYWYRLYRHVRGVAGGRVVLWGNPLSKCSTALGGVSCATYHVRPSGSNEHCCITQA